MFDTQKLVSCIPAVISRSIYVTIGKESMIVFFKRIASAMLVTTMVFFAVSAGHAQAGAVNGLSQAAQNILPQMPHQVQKVHGCHRSSRIGPLTGILHFHAEAVCKECRSSGPVTVVDKIECQ